MLLLAPALLTVGLLFGGGLFFATARSVNYIPATGEVAPNLNSYRALLASPDFYESLVLSLYIASVSTILAVVIALAASLVLRSTTPGRAVVSFLFRLNLTIPHVVGALGILYLFSQSGTFSRLATSLTLINSPSEFPAMVFDPLAIGIILEYVWKEVPFIALIILAKMQTINTDYESVARTLGATQYQALRHVLLPLLTPSVVAATAIVFSFTFGAYEVPLILGQSYPLVLPVVAFRFYTDVDISQRETAMAVAIIIAFVAAFFVAIWYRSTIRSWAR